MSEDPTPVPSLCREREGLALRLTDELTTSMFLCDSTVVVGMRQSSFPSRHSGSVARVDVSCLIQVSTPVQGSLLYLTWLPLAGLGRDDI